MMDTLHFGYPRWYVFCSSAVIIGQDEKFWLSISRLIAIAYELHIQLQTHQSKNGENPNNPEHPEIIQEVVAKFQNATFDQFDSQFDNPTVRDVFHM